MKNSTFIKKALLPTAIGITFAGCFTSCNSRKDEPVAQQPFDQATTVAASVEPYSFTENYPLPAAVADAKAIAKLPTLQQRKEKYRNITGDRCTQPLENGLTPTRSYNGGTLEINTLIHAGA